MRQVRSSVSSPFLGGIGCEDCGANDLLLGLAQVGGGGRRISQPPEQPEPTRARIAAAISAVG